jgi:hypothetical protein
MPAGAAGATEAEIAILSLNTWRSYMSFVRRADPVSLATPGASISGRVWRDGGGWSPTGPTTW